MKRFAVVLLAWSVTRLALGHGFELTLDGNQIDAASEVPTISSHLFVETLTLGSPTQLFTDHGGVEAGAGFSIPPDSLSVEFLGPLWYSTGGSAHHAADGLNLNATSFDSQQAILGSVNITGSSAKPGSFPIAGDDDHSIGWILSGATIPAGAYGFTYRVTGFKDGDETKPFAPAFHSSLCLIRPTSPAIWKRRKRPFLTPHYAVISIAMASRTPLTSIKCSKH